MTGRIIRLIDEQQFGTIAGADGLDYQFSSLSLIHATFAGLHVGATVTFRPIAATRRAEAVRLGSTAQDVERLR